MEAQSASVLSNNASCIIEMADLPQAINNLSEGIKIFAEVVGKQENAPCEKIAKDKLIEILKAQESKIEHLHRLVIGSRDLHSMQFLCQNEEIDLFTYLQKYNRHAVNHIQAQDQRISKISLIIACAACAAVIINVVDLSLIGQYHDSFPTIAIVIRNVAACILSTAVVFGISKA